MANPIETPSVSKAIKSHKPSHPCSSQFTLLIALYSSSASLVTLQTSLPVAAPPGASSHLSSHLIGHTHAYEFQNSRITLLIKTVAGPSVPFYSKHFNLAIPHFYREITYAQ